MRIALLSIIALASIATPAHAQVSDQQWAACENGEGKLSTEQAMKGCTDLIATGKLSGDDLANAYAFNGDLLSDKGDYTNAIASYGEAIKAAPKYSGAYNNRGLAYMASGDAKNALADYTQAIRLGPKTSSRYYNHGLAAAKLGDHLTAIGDFSQALVLDDTNAAAYRARGDSKTARKDDKGAAADYAMATKLAPETPKANPKP
jgi:tetratricopeptide (TPR) repeat protein